MCALKKQLDAFWLCFRPTSLPNSLLLIQLGGDHLPTLMDRLTLTISLQYIRDMVFSVMDASDN